MISALTTITDIVDRIRTGQITRIVALTGAGISTAAGIPDFRTPTSGLYDQLAPLKLPYPEAIFHINYFSHTPEPFYAIARARHPRNLLPTISHAFLALLARKNLLSFLFTQNIDGLELDAGVPAEKVLQTHGSWKTQRCHKCKVPYPDDLMQRAIRVGDVPYCLEAGCGGAVKPDVVFFGEALPERFEVEEKRLTGKGVDLMLVMGTSLKVAPCSRLPQSIGEGIPRILINREKVGDLGTREADVCLLGTCDEGVRQLADALGWRDELEGMWADAVERKEETNRRESWDEEGPTLEESIQKLTEKMKEAGRISQGHRRMLEQHLGAKFAHVLPRKSVE
ncbi:SIR2 family NAD-dependent protein deacylase [Aspergillus ibericus CBS 121593]|uniref:NAD-dependent protein deacetylase n=1 Tax=Aspergillus ibericus CBS 121593 TaxID=1448316 RepID=A0A395H6H0_9EURO|nr:NAD-dependent deacetylase sirtuin-2 [Aspergillus ibericus CBS 121593]RAL03216.1 NAD-dependent deacetylase sirtuin-2 [Aspergillus ibericus CBS 121593]